MARVVETSGRDLYGPRIEGDALVRRRARTPALVSLRVTKEAERAFAIRRLAELSRPIAPARTCQFPTADNPFTVCGHASVPGMSWCEDHRAVVFRKTEKPRDVFPWIPARGAR